jgi:hypothetical protein
MRPRRRVYVLIKNLRLNVFKDGAERISEPITDLEACHEAITYSKD